MDSNYIIALIGAFSTVIAGILGGILGRSDGLDRFFVRNRFPKLAGTRWESSWIDKEGGKAKTYKEQFEFTSQKKNHIYGHIIMDSFPDLKWDIEGDYNDRFLRLLWHPSPNAQNKFFLDYGCYFFERQGPGYFEGYAVGFDSQSNKIEIGKHHLRQLQTN